jgi:hypothetical protein
MSINYVRCHRADIEVELPVLVQTSRGKGNVMKKALTIILLIAFAAPILGSSAYAGPRRGGNSQGNDAQGQQGSNYQGSNAQGQQGQQ